MKLQVSKTYRQIKKLVLALLIVSSIAVACNKEDVNPGKTFDYLVESQFIATVNKVQVKLLASQYQDIHNLIQDKELSDVGVFKITYKTTNVEGEEIIASGAVVVPITSGAVPVISYQHGTLTNPTDAPSKYSTGIEVRGLATILASAGYAISMPDYLGYGESEDYPHPYEHAKTLGSASFDMLMAAKEFFTDNEDITVSDKLFLAGYSEGGNATMALHQKIESSSELVVTMSAPAAGAYNKTEFAKAVLQTNENLRFLPRFMWVFQSYNWVYGLNRTWEAYVNPTDAATLGAISDPMKLGGANISLNPQDLFTTDFSQGIINGTDTEFLAALAENDNFNWHPRFPITLYYGTADDYVFPINSETAYDALLANGATVTKVAFEGKDHGTALVPYIVDAFELFESLK